MAQTVETHYDNLRVMRDAPLADIKASYRLLAQKYHPDRNPAPDAMHKMQMINKAWDVLSDPERRARHDSWIAHQERRVAAPPVRSAPVAAPEPEHWQARFAVRVAAVSALALVVLIAGAFLINAARVNDEDDDSPVAGQAAQPGRAEHGYVFADNGTFLKGPVSFDIDNTSGRHDVEVRLYRDDGREAHRMFVHSGRSYALNYMRYGHYTLRYKVVVDGAERAFQARQVFALVQTPEEAREGRYNEINPIRTTHFRIVNGPENADEIALHQF
ncbi:MAG: J domain-containing protein [Pseudomonadota bacterium]